MKLKSPKMMRNWVNLKKQNTSRSWRKYYWSCVRILKLFCTSSVTDRLQRYLHSCNTLSGAAKTIHQAHLIGITQLTVRCCTQNKAMGVISPFWSQQEAEQTNNYYCEALRPTPIFLTHIQPQHSPSKPEEAWQFMAPAAYFQFLHFSARNPLQHCPSVREQGKSVTEQPINLLSYNQVVLHQMNEGKID